MPPEKFPLHDEALSYARSQLGVYESPLGTNRGSVQRTHPVGGVDFYQSHDIIPGVGYPWCVTLALTAWEVGANHPLPYKTAGAYALLQWARSVGWYRYSTNCIPGDILIFNYGSGHAAMLESQAGNNVVTIDGNWNNRVMRCTHSRFHCLGGVHIPEAAKLPPPPPAPKPYWVIATDHKGKRVLLFSKFASEKTVLSLLPKLFAKYGKQGVTIKRGGTRKK